MLKKKHSDNWTKHHENAVRTAVLGGFPSQVSAFKLGEADSPTCGLCGQEDGTHQHLFLHAALWHRK